MAARGGGSCVLTSVQKRRQQRRAPQLRPPRVVSNQMRHNARVLLDSGRVGGDSSVE
jgi:hypothetical protein